MNCLMCWRALEPGYGAGVEVVYVGSLVERAVVCAWCANKLRLEGVQRVEVGDRLIEVRLVKLEVAP